MYRLLFVLLLVCVTVPACQCSDKPDIGPVEGGQAAAAAVEAPARA